MLSSSPPQKKSRATVDLSSHEVRATRDGLRSNIGQTQDYNSKDSSRKSYEAISTGFTRKHPAKFKKGTGFFDPLDKN
jgi:hypothetical protein